MALLRHLQGRLLFLLALSCSLEIAAQEQLREVAVAKGWAANSVNVAVFRRSALTSFGDRQYIAFYDDSSRVVLGLRMISDTNWTLQTTAFRGNTRDAHNTISLGVDGDQVLHIAWDHHNNVLHYARGVTPGSLEMRAAEPMTGLNEQKVTYPEFYRLPNGNLIFLYRDGGSGNGNLVVNRYETATGRWQQLHNNLVNGEGKRNAYWQAAVDNRGTIHVSWVWRESPDVASNHDLCYARSRDGGITWERSNEEAYTLPITSATAEYAARILQQSELINQTSMYAGTDGTVYIATYWRPAGETVPQYRVVHGKNGQWATAHTNFRKLAFTLGGHGTKKLPIARPQIVVWEQALHHRVAFLFRDAERGSKVSLASCDDLPGNKWKVVDLTDEAVGDWEPNIDADLFRASGRLHVFVQQVEQVDGEGNRPFPPQMIKVLEYVPPLLNAMPGR